MRKLLALGTVAITAVTVALVVAATAFGTHVTPTFTAGNPTCSDLSPGTTELKVEPVADGTFSDGTLTVTIDVRNTADGQVFDWTSNIGVDSVFVKGGPGGNLYVYDPESTGDTGLHAPVNPNNDKFFGLSHVSFCYDAEPPTTTTTTTDPKTTTTDPKTTTTDPKATTTVPK
jgi:hypothetical protein